MKKRTKSGGRRYSGMNEVLVEQAMRKMSPSAFHKMLAFSEAWEKSDGEGMAAALLDMTKEERQEVVEVVKLALGEEEVL